MSSTTSDPTPSVPSPPTTAPPSTPTSTPKPPSSAGAGATLGQRLAGAVLVLNACFVTFEQLVLSNQLGSEGMPSSPVTALLDFGLGLALVAGQRSVVGFVLFRVVVGALVFGGMHLAQGDGFSVGIQLVFSLSLVALLVGDAGRARMAFAGVATVGVLGLELLGIRMLTTGEAPSADLLALQYELEETSAEVFESDSVPVRIGSLPAGWRPRSAAAAARDNPSAALWLVEARYDAHLLVITESLPAGQVVDPEAFVDVVVENGQAGMAEFALVDRGFVPAVHTLGTRLDATAQLDGLPMRYRYGIYTEGRHMAQIVCFARTSSFPAIEEACDATLESLEFLDAPVLAKR